MKQTSPQRAAKFVILLWVKPLVHFGVGAPPILFYFSGESDVHWGYRILTKQKGDHVYPRSLVPASLCITRGCGGFAALRSPERLDLLLPGLLRASHPHGAEGTGELFDRFPGRGPVSLKGCVFFSPTAESFGVSAQIGSGVVRGSSEVRFHEGSTRVPPGFHQGFTRVPRGFHEVLRGLRGGASTKKSTACCWGYHLSLFFLGCEKQGAALTPKRSGLKKHAAQLVWGLVYS